MQSLPKWMNPQKQTPVFDEAIPRKKQRNIARRTLAGLVRLLTQVLTSDDLSTQHGLLQSIDARAKVLSLMGLVVIATLIHNPEALALCYVFCIALGLLSQVPIRKLARVWLVVPIFSAGIMLPATLNVITEGNHLWTLWHFTNDSFGPWRLPDTLAVTDAGLIIMTRFVMRTALCVSLAVLLTSTTRPALLFRGLKVFGVPRIFIMLLGMMQRYLAVLIKSAEEIHLAKISRSVTSTNLRQEQAWVASGMGSLFRRTRAMGNAVYLAMLSRGYTGEVHLLDDPKWRTRALAFIGFTAAVSALMLMMS